MRNAAGFALPSERVAALRERMHLFAAATPLPAATSFPCEAEVRFADLDRTFLDTYERLGPFGHGNTEPVFLARRVRLQAPFRVLKERHLALQVTDESSPRPWRAMAWSRRFLWSDRARDEGWDVGTCFDMAFRLSRNWHPDFGGWELAVEQVWPAQGEAATARQRF